MSEREQGASGKGLIDIAASRISDEESRRSAARQFEDIGDKVVRRLLPIFENIEEFCCRSGGSRSGSHLSGPRLRRIFPGAEFSTPPNWVTHYVLSDHYQRHVLPGGSLPVRKVARRSNPLPRGHSGEPAQIRNSSGRAALGRLSRIGADLDKVLNGISRIERLVQQKDGNETTRRYEADYREAVQRNLDYLELFGADINPKSTAPFFKRWVCFVEYYFVNNFERGGHSLG